MKLKRILKENTIEKDAKLTREQKRQIMASVSKFNEYGGSIYRKKSMAEVVKAIKELAENASNLALQEAGDWFDSVSVKKDVKEINNSVGLFEKTMKEMNTLQQRLESVFEDIGGKLGKYYEINEGVDNIDDEEAAKDFDDLKDKI